MSHQQAQVSRLPQLDVLRFVAALSVTLYHYVSCYPLSVDATTGIVGALAHVTRYGYLGVDLFFIISGFVILWSSLGRSAVQFVISRVSRLYPAFWVSLSLALVLSVTLGPLLPAVATPPLSAKTVLANATMLPAIFKVPLVEGVYWTLEIEIRFYALIFVLLVLRQMRYIEAWLFAWLAVSIINLFVPMPWIVRYLTVDPYGPFFVAGCLFYLVLSRGLSAPRLIGLVISALTCAYVSIEQRKGFLTPDATSAWVVPSLVLAFFALFAWIACRRDRTMPDLPYAKPLGDLTYSLYLTHATMGLFIYHLLRPIAGVGASVTAITALSLAVAWFITRTVDIPSRKPITRLLNRIADSLGLLRAGDSRQAQST